MTALFIAMVLAVFAGGVSMWLSGLLVGRRGRAEVETAYALEMEQLRAEKGRLESLSTSTSSRFDENEARLTQAETLRAGVETDLKRAVAELERVEGEMARAGAELTRLREENERLKRAAEKRVPERPAAESAPDDMEGAPTRPEIDPAAPPAEGHASPPPLPIPGMGVPGRRGSSMPTLSIAMRGALPTPSSEPDRLRQANEQLKRDKEQVEAELARAQQELQLLRMRQ